MGACYEKLNNNDLAVQFYEKTLHQDPSLDKGWIAITRFYIKKRNYQRALYLINKAINIDNDNVIYWKLYSQINQRLSFFEEAERGYKRALELGNYELSTWLSRGDILIKLGEPQAAIYNFEQAIDFYPENAEIEYRLAGLYFTLNETDKGAYHLKNGLKYNEEYTFILDELFPEIINKLYVKNLLKANQ
jgi:tetratricopeptide (TPR) repeat protein